MNAQSLKPIVLLLVTAAANVANACGYAFDMGTVYNVVFSVASAALVAWCWWKNQNVTEAAQRAQEYLDELKGGTPDEG